MELLVKPALFVPSRLPEYQVLEKFKEAQAQIAFITDEHGGAEGLVTFITIGGFVMSYLGRIPQAGDEFTIPFCGYPKSVYQD